MPLLEVKKLTKNFGGLAAVSHVDLHLETNELVGLIGPNGAGKTTLFNLLTGVYEPSEGDVLLEEQGQSKRLNGRSPILSQLWDYPAPSKTFGCSKILQ